jgi:thiamine-phosphate pyrophosphorylase
VIRLYLITPPAGDPAPAVEAALAVLPRGAAGVQLRQPDRSARELLGNARTLRGICSRFAAPLLVNDRADVALAAGADGVHLPGRGLSASDVRELGFDLVGVSAHSPEEVARASREGADFVVFAPVYDTPGKTARGEAALAEACRAAPIPVLALGGVNETNAHRCIEAGARGIACIRSVLGAPDPAAAAIRLWQALAFALVLCASTFY